jgi:hypothetical protein
VLLAEGPSEVLLLPKIAKLVFHPDGKTCDFDRANISVINVGGKDHLAAFSDLLEAFAIEWRVVADRDSLVGDSLKLYRSKAGLAGSESPEAQMNQLGGIGVAVLSQGEIEDYYPPEALAEIANCEPAHVSAHVEAHRAVWDEPKVFSILEAMFQSHRNELLATEEPRIPKVLKRCYDQTIEQLRTGEAKTTLGRKTGAALSEWLKMPKPLIAVYVGRWLEANPGRVPARLQKLVRWVWATIPPVGGGPEIGSSDPGMVSNGGQE